MHALRALAFLLFSATVVAAEQSGNPSDRDFIERLPRAWCGIFRWEGEALEQVVTFSLVQMERRADGSLELKGPGRVRYRHEPLDRAVPFHARAVVEPATRRIELFESIDVPRVDYVTDGSHVGELAPDLQSMRLVWTTRGTGRRGASEFFARPAQAELAQECGVPSS